MPDNVINNVITLAASEEDAQFMKRAAEQDGMSVKGTTVWSGPIPEGSYEPVLGMPWVRMSTPEFFFFRKANQLLFVDAVLLGAELMSHFRTQSTAHNMRNGLVELLDEPRTDYENLRLYLWQVKDTEEGQRALAVLERANEILDEFEEAMSMRLMTSLVVEALA